MEYIYILKKLSYYNSKKSIILSDGAQNLELSFEVKSLVIDIMEFFKKPKSLSEFKDHVNNSPKYLSLIDVFLKYKFLVEIDLDKVLLDKNEPLSIITESKYILFMEKKLKDLGFENVLVYSNLKENIKRRSVAVIYLPFSFYLLEEIMDNFEKYPFRKFIICSVYQEEIFITMLHPPRTACPRCLLNKLKQNLPLYNKLLSNDYVTIIPNSNTINDLATQLLMNNLERVTFSQSQHSGNILGSLLIFNTKTNKISSEKIVRSHNCTCLDTLDFSLSDLIGNHVGLIKAIGEVRTNYLETNMVFLSGYIGRQVMGGCVDYNWERANKRTLYECLERYSWRNVGGVENFTINSWEKLDYKETISLDKLNLYSDSQYNIKEFPYRKIEPETLLEWTITKRLSDDYSFYIPTQFISGAHIIKGRFRPKTSTGLAAGETFEFALENAVFELIERDVVTRYWYGILDALIITPCDIIEDLEAYKRCKLVGYGIKIIYINNDYGIHVIVCQVSGSNNQGEYFGSASGINLFKTIEKAILEALLMKVYKNSKGELNYIHNLNNIVGEVRVSKLEINKDKTKIDKSNIYYIDITSPELKEKLSVVKVWGSDFVDFSANKNHLPKVIIEEGNVNLEISTFPFK